MLLGAAAALVWLFRTAFWQAAVQIISGAALALCALPLMRKLERRLPSGASAALSLAVLLTAAALCLLLLAPPLLRQGKQLASVLPGLYATAGEWLLDARIWLQTKGLGGQSAFDGTFGRGHPDADDEDG